MKRMALAAVLAVSMLSGIVASSASAWQPQHPCGAWNNFSCTTNWGYDSFNGFCAKDYAEASNGAQTWGTGGGFSKGNVGAFIWDQTTPNLCSRQNYNWNRGAEQLNVHIQYWKYFTINNRGWDVCRDFYRQYNSSPNIDNFTSYYTWGNGASPCGPGWYETHMSGYVWNGAWYGGQNKSGQNYIYK